MRCYHCETLLDWDAADEIVRCPGCHCYRLTGLPETTARVVVPLAQVGRHRCPGCRGVLRESAIDGLWAESCSNCRALLMPQAMFAMYVRNRRDDFREAAVRPFPLQDRRCSYQCPVCRRSLKTHPTYGPDGMTVHECGECSLVWIADLIAAFACPADHCPEDLEASGEGPLVPAGAGPPFAEKRRSNPSFREGLAIPQVPAAAPVIRLA